MACTWCGWTREMLSLLARRSEELKPLESKPLATVISWSTWPFGWWLYLMIFDDICWYLMMLFFSESDLCADSCWSVSMDVTSAWPQAPTIRMFLGAMACYLRRGATAKGHTGRWTCLGLCLNPLPKRFEIVSELEAVEVVELPVANFFLWESSVGIGGLFLATSHLWISGNLCWCRRLFKPWSYGTRKTLREIEPWHALPVNASLLPKHCHDASVQPTAIGPGPTPLKDFKGTGGPAKPGRDLRKGLWHLLTSFDIFWHLYHLLAILKYYINITVLDLLPWHIKGPRNDPSTPLDRFTPTWCSGLSAKHTTDADGVKLLRGTCCSHMPCGKCVESKSRFRLYQRPWFCCGTYVMLKWSWRCQVIEEIWRNMTTTSPDVRFHLDVWAVCYRPVQVGWKRLLAAGRTWELAAWRAWRINHAVSCIFRRQCWSLKTNSRSHCSSAGAVDLRRQCYVPTTTVPSDAFRLMLHHGACFSLIHTIVSLTKGMYCRHCKHSGPGVRTLADTVIGCAGFRHQGAQSFSSPGVKLELVAGENLRGKA